MSVRGLKRLRIDGACVSSTLVGRSMPLSWMWLALRRHGADAERSCLPRLGAQVKLTRRMIWRLTALDVADQTASFKVVEPDGAIGVMGRVVTNVTKEEIPALVERWKTGAFDFETTVELGE